MAQLLTTPYSASLACGAQTRSDWQVATDANFSNIIKESLDDSINLTQWLATIDTGPGGQYENVPLFARARHKSATCISEWSDTKVCIVGTLPPGTIDAPTLTVSGSPNNIQTGPHLSAGPFHVSLNAGGTGNDIHLATTWMAVETSTGNVAWQSLNDHDNLTDIQIPANTLTPGMQYDFKVVYHGALYNGNVTSVTWTIQQGPYIETPTITVEGELYNVPTGPVISGSPFNIVGSTENHTLTDWYAYDSSNNIVWSDIGSSDLTITKIPDGTLDRGSQYTIKAVYHSTTYTSGIADKTIHANYYGSWSPLTSLPYGLREHSQSVISGNKIFINGGVDNNGLKSGANMVFDPQPNGGGGLWSVIPAPQSGPVPTPRYDHGQVSVVQGTSDIVFIFGGVDAGTNPEAPTNEIYRYSVDTNTWAQMASMPVRVRGHGVVLLPNGDVLVVGGIDETGAYLTDCGIYSIANDTFTIVDPIPGNGVAYMGISVLQDGRVMITGGLEAGTPPPSINTIRVFDPVAPSGSQWSTFTIGGNPVSLPNPQAYHGQATLDNGNVLICSGVVANNIIASTVELDITNGNYIQHNPTPTAIARHICSVNQNGDVVIVGGTGNGFDSLAGTYIYK